MDIDSFYQDEDMTFGMDGRIHFADEYAYLFGSKKKARARATGRAEEVKNSFPVSEDCGKLALSIATLKQNIADAEVKLTGKVGRGDKRVTNDYLNAWRNQKSVLEAKQRELKCAEKAEQEELGSFMSQLQQTTATSMQTSMQNTGGINTKGGDKTKATTYILFGVGGLVLLGVTIFVMKKVNK
jgi:hypothetical protein